MNDESIKYQSYASPLGEIVVYASREGLRGLIMSEAKGEKPSLPMEEGENDSLIKARAQLEEYFQGARRDFSLPMDLKGTPFQQQLWRLLTQIKGGQVMTYGQLAKRMGSIKLSRAVGQACGSNPLPIIVPCHRVLGKGMKLGGYSSGLENKKSLLRLEGIEI